MYQWLRFYQQVYEMPPTDRPADDIIDDDHALDLWYEQFLNHAAAQASLQRAQQNGGAPAGIPVSKDSLPRFGG